MKWGTALRKSICFYFSLLVISHGLFAEPNHAPDTTAKREVVTGNEIYAIKPEVPLEKAQSQLFDEMEAVQKRTVEAVQKLKSEFGMTLILSRGEIETYLANIKTDLKKPSGISPGQYKILKEQDRFKALMNQANDIPPVLDFAFTAKLSKITVGRELCNLIYTKPIFKDKKLETFENTKASAGAMYSVQAFDDSYYTFCAFQRTDDNSRTRLILHFSKDFKLIEVFTTPPEPPHGIPNLKKILVKENWEPVHFAMTPKPSNPLVQNLSLSKKPPFTEPTTKQNQSHSAEYFLDTSLSTYLDRGGIQNLSIVYPGGSKLSKGLRGLVQFASPQLAEEALYDERMNLCELSNRLKRAGVQYVDTFYIADFESVQTYLKKGRTFSEILKQIDEKSGDNFIDYIRFITGKEIKGPTINGSITIGEDASSTDIEKFFSTLPSLKKLRENRDQIRKFTDRIAETYGIFLNADAAFLKGDSEVTLKTLQSLEASLKELPLNSLNFTKIDISIGENSPFWDSKRDFNIPLGTECTPELLKKYASPIEKDTLEFRRQIKNDVTYRPYKKDLLQDEQKKQSHQIANGLKLKGTIKNSARPEAASNIYKILEELANEGLDMSKRNFQNIVLIGTGKIEICPDKDDLICKRTTLCIGSQVTKEELRKFFGI